MIFVEEYGGYITVKCEKCGANIKRHKSYCKNYGNEYHFNPPLTCTHCGNTEIIATKRSDKPSYSQPNVNDEIKCPKCGSTQITAGKKGFGLGNAAIGGAVLGPVGLLGGFVGSGKVIVTCLNCGKQWKAGKQ